MAKNYVRLFPRQKRCIEILHTSDFFKENHKVINQLDGRLNELELANQVKFIVENEIIGKELNKIDNDFENINKNSFDQNNNFETFSRVTDAHVLWVARFYAF